MPRFNRLGVVDFSKQTGTTEPHLRSRESAPVAPAAPVGKSGMTYREVSSGLTLFVGVVVIGASSSRSSVCFLQRRHRDAEASGISREASYRLRPRGSRGVDHVPPSDHEPDQTLPEHIACGTSWQAMFSARWNGDYECGHAAFPHL
jgi:hypothetical protein